MIDSEYGFRTYDALNTAGLVSKFYDSMSMKIDYKGIEFAIRGADMWTGNALAREYLEAEMAENQHYLSNVVRGITMIQDTQFQIENAEDKLARMEELAEMAASGEYSAAEVEGFQSEFDTLIEDIDAIAIRGSFQDENMLSYDGTVEIEVGSGLSETVSTMDMTVSGLGILDNVDLVNDPEGALAGVQAAISEVDSYDENLSGSLDTLEGVQEVLLDERQDMKEAYAQVDSRNSALQIIAKIAEWREEMAGFIATIKADQATDKILDLLADE